MESCSSPKRVCPDDNRKTSSPSPREKEKRQKAQERWKKLKGSLNLVTNAVKACEQDKKILTQGLRLNRKIKYSKDITDVKFLPNRLEYIVISDKKAQFLTEDGRKKNAYDFKFTNIVYNMELKRFIGWTKDEYQLNLLSMRFETLHTVNCPDKIQHVAFNPCVNELVSVCGTYLCIWIFQHGSKILVLKHKVKITKIMTDIFSGIVIQKSASQQQKCFLSRDVDVYVFQVRSAKFLLHKKDLHQQKISAMTFFDPFKILVTGSLDGCIKIWNHRWNILMVFVSHENSITNLCPFPGTTAQLLSTSSDLTFRVWNLDAQEEIGRTAIEENVQIFGCQPEKEIFHACTGNTLTIWKIEKLFHLHMSIGFEVTLLKVTSHPVYPQRATVVTNDLTVRLVMPHTAQLITKLIIPATDDLEIIDTAYAIAEDVLFVSLSNATIIKASTKSHPCNVIDTWKFQNEKLSFKCLILYEHVASTIRHDEMTSLMKNLTTQTVKSGMLATPKNTNRTILIGGTSDGHICVLDWQTGRPNVCIQAHNHSEVLSMVANVRFDQVISSGRDHVIKTWRFYPFAAECLVPLMSFYCSYVPTQLTVMKNLLCIAFQDGNSLNYSTLAYDLTNSERFNHSAEDDHLDNVVTLAACPKMNIFASASQDGSLKIWNETNNLIKTLNLAACPTSLCFYGNKGDLLIGIGFHLYKIPYTCYLPNSYQMKTSLMVEEPMVDEPIPEDEDKVKELEKFQKVPSQAIRRLPIYEDNLTKEEAEQLILEKQEKAHAFKVFTDRENDLRLIKDGKYFSTKKVTSQSKTIQNEAFENYLKLIYDKVNMQVPSELNFLNDDIDEMVSVPRIKKDYPELKNRMPEKIPAFFPDWRSAYTRPLPPEVKVQFSHRINPNSYLPNSVLIKLLWPDREPQKIEDGKKQHSIELKKLFDNLKHVVPQQVEKEYPVLPPSPISTSSSSEQIPIPETPSPESLSEAILSVEKTETLETVEEVLPVDTANAETVIVEGPEGRNSVIKYVSRPKSSYAAEITPASSASSMLRLPSATLSREVEITTPEEDNYPPEVGKYQEMEWFKTCFPEQNQVLPRPWNSEAFVNNLLEVMPTASADHRSEILLVVMDVFVKYGSANKDVIYETVKDALKRDPLEMACIQESEKVFVKSALKNLYTFFLLEDDFMVYLVAYFVHGDREIKKIILNSLKSMGMKDDSSYYLCRELDTWNISDFEKNSIWLDTLEKARLWLDEWKARFIEHLQISMNMLKSGKNIQGHLSREQLKSATKLRQNFTMDSQSATVDLNFDDRCSTVEQVTYIEVVNYFCEMKTEAAMMKKPKTPVKPVQDGIDKTNSKNTVLMLPPIIKHKNLTRLGETHCSTCKPHRETVFYTDYQKPPVTCQGYLPHQMSKGISPKFHYYTPKITLDPFSDSKYQWDPDINDSVLVTVRVWPKYFVPAMSVIPPIS